jgi:hypothetical protein
VVAVFRRNVLPPSSGLSLAGCHLGLLFDPEVGGSTLVQNIGKLPPDYTASHSKKYEFS